MAKYASKVVELAQSWIGKNESDGSHKSIIDIYNSQKKLPRGYKVKYSDEWCATTVSAVAVKLGYTDIIPTECSCQFMIELFKELGIWKENENRIPNPGDIIFYDWQDDGKGNNKGWADHVGIVENVSGNTITVIEGNYNQSVKRRTLEVNGKYIRGYGTPKYDTKATKAPSKSKAKFTCYPKYAGSSVQIDVVLKDIGVSSAYYGSYIKRKPIAAANGIKNYTGTMAQNTALVSLAKKGKLKKA